MVDRARFRISFHPATDSVVHKCNPSVCGRAPIIFISNGLKLKTDHLSNLTAF